MALDDEFTEKQYPPAMLDMGTPTEMSPIRDVTNSSGELPMVEIRQPIQAGEPWEIREPLSPAENWEERVDFIE